MTRRFLGFANVLLTLLVCGCQMPRAARTNPAQMTSELSPKRIAPTPPQHLPDIMPPSAEAQSPMPPRNDALAQAAKFGPFTKEPTAPQAPNVELGVVQTAGNNKLPIDTQPKHPIVIALDCILDNRNEEALKALQGYDPRTQEFLLRVLPTLSPIAKNNALRPADIAAQIQQMDSIIHFLQQNSEFSLSKVCFCETIRGYAIYKPLPADHEFLAALPDRPGELVQLYVELKNFTSRQNQGSFETLLASQVEIRDEKGQVKWSHRFRPDDLKLVSRTKLNEYYHNYTFALPSNLAPGNYTLIVDMIDETQPDAPRAARNALPLRIAGVKN